MPDATNTVAVVMSTYNGERFLREQLDSILRQEGVRVRLFVRDDGSRDGTAAILAEYAAAWPDAVLWDENDRENLGVRDSFLTLLRRAYDACPETDFFAFADQDDVWAADKLAAAVALMRAQSPDRARPALYYSNKTFVDADLRLISEEHIRFYGDFFDILWQSLASGCTMVLDRPMVELSVRDMPEQFESIHDAWCYRLAVMCGAALVFDPVSHILYRQHGDNVCGQKTSILIGWKTIRNAFSANRFGIRRLLAEVVRLRDRDIAPENRQYVDWVMTYDKSFSAWWRLAMSPLARKRGLVSHFVWVVKLALHRI